MPTTFVLRLTSLLTRSNGLVLQILVQCDGGKAAKAVRSSRASVSMAATAGNLGASMAATLSSWSMTSAPVGWAKMVRMAAATISAEPRGTRARTFLRKWTRKETRCRRAGVRGGGRGRHGGPEFGGGAIAGSSIGMRMRAYHTSKPQRRTTTPYFLTASFPAQLAGPGP